MKNVISTLIVEDNEFLRKSFSEIVKMYIPNIRIRGAADGKEAFKRIEESLPDIIFMDVQLPGTSGLELTKEIKERYAKVIVCVFTNYDIPEYREAARNSGADCYLIKDTLTGSDIARLITILYQAAHGL